MLFLEMDKGKFCDIIKEAFDKGKMNVDPIETNALFGNDKCNSARYYDDIIT